VTRRDDSGIKVQCEQRNFARPRQTFASARLAAEEAAMTVLIIYIKTF
jgi:hypothetical protein